LAATDHTNYETNTFERHPGTWTQTMYAADAFAASCKEKPRPNLHLLGLAARAVVAGSPIARFILASAIHGSTHAGPL
jgi:hypothetical protein